MKFSEFKAIATKEAQAMGFSTPGVIANIVGAAAIGAEIVGATWDLEEASLPKKINWRSDVGSPTGYAVLTQASGDDFSTIEEEAVYPEAVRRYNAWPAIRAWAKLKYGGPQEPFWQGLFKLLDGPEGRP